MDRRRFLMTSLAGVLATPLAAQAQDAGRVRRMGVLMGLPESDPRAQARVAAFRDGLQALGWAESRDIRIDVRWATTSDGPTMQRLAKELIALHGGAIAVESEEGFGSTFTVTLRKGRAHLGPEQIAERSQRYRSGTA